MKIEIELSELEAECFRIIRREACDIINHDGGDSELGSFVRGVVEVEKFLFDKRVTDVKSVSGIKEE